MSPNELRTAFDEATTEYIKAIQTSHRALDEAMRSPREEVHLAYKVATVDEEQKRATYLELGWQLRAAINAR